MNEEIKILLKEIEVLYIEATRHRGEWQNEDYYNLYMKLDKATQKAYALVKSE